MAGSAKKSGLWTVIEAQLRAQGIDLEAITCADGESPKVKVVCVAPDLQESVVELGKSPRGQVVMVRVDEETSTALDAWVESGAVRSRSEAAALFIREGLKVRAGELEKLRDALRKVEVAKQQLRDRAREVFGGSGESDGAGERS